MDKKWTAFSQTIENIRKSLNTLHHLKLAHTLKKYSGYADFYDFTQLYNTLFEGSSIINKEI